VSASREPEVVEIEPVDLPHFTHASEVHFDELDAWQMLHNSRYGLHVERATMAWHLAVTGNPYGPADDPDQFVFMREFQIEFEAPVTGPQTIWVDIWRTRRGRSSFTHVFQCRNEDGSVVFARGRKTVVRIDPATGKPTPWSDELRRAAAAEDARREERIRAARRDTRSMAGE
jgi:acyl-CoA thioester hydrolase